MDNNYLEIGGKLYGIDLEKIMDFISKPQEVTQTINQSYGIPITQDGETVTVSNDITLVNKEVSETKTSPSEAQSTLRYNIIANIINLVLMPISDNEGVVMISDTASMHLGQRLCFNTLYEMGIIYEIDPED